MDVRVGLQRALSTEELMLLDYGGGEDSWESNQSILKEISPEYSLEGLMLKLKLQYFSPLDAKSWLIEKDPDAGKDWRRDKGTTGDEIVGWTQWNEFGQASGVGDGLGSLVCCSSWVCKESDMTEQLNWDRSLRITFSVCPLSHVSFLGSFFRPPTVQPSFNLHLLSKILYIFFHLFTHKCLFLSYFKGGNYYGIFPLMKG